jgi:hypothetical protein
MKSARRFNTIIAVAFAIALILCGSAQASNLLGLGRDGASRTAMEPSAGLLEQVSAWLLGAWTEVESVFAGTPPGSPTTTAAGCDAGWGLDPEGCPK